MGKFRKKPVVVEAEQFMGVPSERYPNGVCFCAEVDDGGGSPHAHVHTLEGPLKASVGDLIIKGVKGEFYPCKPDVFDATYEPVNEDLIA